MSVSGPLCKPSKAGTFWLPVMDISIRPESGWRDIQDTVVAQFQEAFIESFGMSILGGVKVLVSQRGESTEDISSDVDGKYLLDDGKSTVVALQNLFTLYEAGKLQEDACCEALLSVFKDGLPVTGNFYPDSDFIHRLAWNTSTHDEENNKFLCSSVADKVLMVRRVAGLYPASGKWPSTIRYLTDMYGKSKERNIRRWVNCAKSVDDHVIKYIQLRVKEKGVEHRVSQGYIIDNPYFTGLSSQAQQLLPVEWQIAALQQVMFSVDQGARVSRDDFQTQYCQPLKLASSWISKQERKYGSVATTSHAWTKLKQSMQSSKTMRENILRCITASEKFETAGKGIPECWVLLADFDKQRAGTSAPQSTNPATNEDVVMAPVQSIDDELIESMSAAPSNSGTIGTSSIEQQAKACPYYYYTGISSQQLSCTLHVFTTCPTARQSPSWTSSRSGSSRTKTCASLGSRRSVHKWTTTTSGSCSLTLDLHVGLPQSTLPHCHPCCRPVSSTSSSLLCVGPTHKAWPM